eukprot:2113284-Pyramimonas_sp.AAC.1
MDFFARQFLAGYVVARLVEKKDLNETVTSINFVFDRWADTVGMDDDVAEAVLKLLTCLRGLACLLGPLSPVEHWGDYLDLLRTGCKRAMKDPRAQLATALKTESATKDMVTTLKPYMDQTRKLRPLIENMSAKLRAGEAVTTHGLITMAKELSTFMKESRPGPAEIPQDFFSCEGGRRGGR